MKARLFTIAIILLLITLFPYLVPSDGKVIILIWHYKIDLHIYLAICLTFLSILTLHWLLNFTTWLRYVPTRIQAYRQQKKDLKHQKYRADGLISLLKKDYMASQKYFTYASSQTETEPLDHLATAYCALHTKTPDIKTAEQHLKSIHDCTLFPAQYAILQAQLQNAKNKPHLAIEILEQVPANQKTTEVLRLLEKLYLQTQQWQLLHDFIESTIKLNNASIFPCTIENIMQKNLLNEKPGYVVKLFENLPTTYKQKTILVIQYTLALVQQGKIDQAIDDSLSHMSKNPQKEIVNHITLLSKYHALHIEATIQKLEAIEKKQTQNPFLPLERGLLYSQKNNAEKAIDAYKKAISILEQLEPSESLPLNQILYLTQRAQTEINLHNQKEKPSSK